MHAGSADIDQNTYERGHASNHDHDPIRSCDDTRDRPCQSAEAEVDRPVTASSAIPMINDLRTMVLSVIGEGVYAPLPHLDALSRRMVRTNLGTRPRDQVRSQAPDWREASQKFQSCAALSRGRLRCTIKDLLRMLRSRDVNRRSREQSRTRCCCPWHLADRVASSRTSRSLANG